MILESARQSGRPTIIDFNFPELPSWRRAKTILDGGAIGRLQNVVVTWNFESRATRLHLDSWKTRGEGGGGLLGNSFLIVFIISNGFAVLSRAWLPGCLRFPIGTRTAALRWHFLSHRARAEVCR